MGLFKNSKKVGLISDIIRCDEPSYLIWKWHPDGTKPGEHKREYAIRSGSSLRVKDGEVAVFVYPQKDGKKQEFIVGPFDQKLKTANLPILSGIIGAFVGGDTPFQAEVYFINLAKVVQTRFAVPFFEMSDPRYPDFTIPVAVRGTISFKIEDYKEFIKVHRLFEFTLEDFEKQIRDMVSRYTKDAVINAPRLNNVYATQIESCICSINNSVEHSVGERLKRDFGVVLSGLDISAIDIDKSSRGYIQLNFITKDVIIDRVWAVHDADMENYSETLRIQREEGQYAQHMRTRNENLSAYQIEKQTEVGIAGAEALGHMGENGAANISLGEGGAGFNPASMMASIALGGVVGQSIAGTMSNALNGTNSNLSVAPPPIPVSRYFVVINGKQAGPYDTDVLSSMANNGEISRDSLVWRQGMSSWAKASDVDELNGLFAPPIPNN